MPLARRQHRSALLAVLAAWSVVGIVTFTAVPDLGLLQYLEQPWSSHRLALLFVPNPAIDLTAWARGTDGPLNVLLYIPAGFFLTVLSRRIPRIVAVLALLSLVTETIQAASGTRSGALGDLVANALGALIGAVLGSIASAVLTRESATIPSTTTDPRERSSPRG